MKVRHRKGIANHPDPESCGGAREGAVEALTGETAGQPLSREIRQSGAPTLLSEAEGNTGEGATREPSTGPTRSKTLSMRRSSLNRNWEISSVPAEHGGGRVGEGQWPQARHPRWREVGCLRSTDERSEQRRRLQTGAGGGSEGRRAAKGNTEQSPAPRTQSRTCASMGLEGVREAARPPRHGQGSAVHGAAAPRHARNC